MYAYAPETDEVLAYVIGTRGIKTVKKLYQLLKNLTIDEYCTDNWAAFARVFSEENHQIGKHLTCHIEGVNSRSLRTLFLSKYLYKNGFFSFILLEKYN
jgi:insertion element IS1 protein InsB